jgi:uncharacterized RDD family membrane protein YckC
MNKPIGTVLDWKTNNEFKGNFNYAGFWIRFVALVIDLIIGFLIAFIILFFVDTDSWGDQAIGFVIFLLILTLRGYFQFQYGQSIGQKFVKVKVVSEHKKTLGRVVARNFLILLFLLIPLGNTVNALVLGLSKEKQALHDRGVDTWVVRENI